MAQGARWYIVHVYSGCESRVAQLIGECASKRGMSGYFEETLIPTEDVVEYRGREKVTVNKKYFPGYILLKMVMNDNTRHLVIGVPKVAGFLGSKGTPSPVSEDEVSRIMTQMKEASEAPRNSVSYEVGDQIKVVDGPFASFSGFVEEIEADRQRLKVSVTIFGRPTLVALEYAQVDKV